MSQNYNHRLASLLENKQSAVTEQDQTNTSTEYAGDGHGRYLCFVWEDMKAQTLNYSYMVSTLFDPQENTIMLWFTTHKVKLQGVMLENLFYQIMRQVPRIITCSPARYNMLEGSASIVNSIDIQEL